MKRLLLFLCSLVTGAVLWAQVPRSFSYQAVVRDAGGQVVAQQTVSVRLSLLQGDAETERYAELHTATTNAAGLVTLAVGGGQPQTDCTMECVDWGGAPVFLRTEVDPAGGSDYTLTTTQQLLLVPYALFAANGLMPGDMERIDGLVSELGQMWATVTAELDGKASAGDLGQLLEALDSMAAAMAVLESRADSLRAMVEELHKESMAGIEANAEAIEALAKKADSLHAASMAGIEANAGGIGEQAGAAEALAARMDSLQAACADGMEALRMENDSLREENAMLKAGMTAMEDRMRHYVDSAIAAAVKSCCKADTVAVEPAPDTTEVAVGWVDLGLPSGLLWATCNVGASTPGEYGDRYAWGETEPKSTYNWGSYKYCTGSDKELTKYCNNSSYGNDSYTDTLTVLEAVDDAATQTMGNGARIPSMDEWQELFDNTTMEWTAVDGVDGCLFTATNGKSVFFPAAGFISGSYVGNDGYYCNYWSSKLNENNPREVRYFYFYYGGKYESSANRSSGLSVRAVRAK